jgi:hypothetical protein
MKAAAASVAAKIESAMIKAPGRKEFVVQLRR